MTEKLAKVSEANTRRVRAFALHVITHRVSERDQGAS